MPKPETQAATPPRRARLDYIDWLRGLAVVLMIQAHAIDSWLRPTEKAGAFYRWSQFLAGAPAPLFLFLAGLALVLLTHRMRERGQSHRAVVREALRRGAQVFLYAIAFRSLAFASSSFRDWPNLFRADILNCIALSMLASTLLVLSFQRWRTQLLAGILLTCALAVPTPLAWDGPLAPQGPHALAVYVNGRLPVSLFPLFPWAAFCSAGVVCGLVIVRGSARGWTGHTLAALTVLGLALYALGYVLDRLPPIFPREDFWHTSPSFFWMRTGVLLALLGLAYLWNRMPWARWPSALRQLGKTSLLVYWVHVEIAYGNVVLPALRQRLGPNEALAGVLLLTLAMLGLSRLRTHGSALWHASRAPLEPYSAFFRPGKKA
jgi:uncharacterized membrane protein